MKNLTKTYADGSEKTFDVIASHNGVDYIGDFFLNAQGDQILKIGTATKFVNEVIFGDDSKEDIIEVLKFESYPIEILDEVYNYLQTKN